VPDAFVDSPEFRRLLAEGAADLCRIALEIARDRFDSLDAGRYLTVIESLAARVRERCPRQAKPQQILGQINWVLFVEENYRGNSEDYYDARNTYLNEVIDRRLGIPISLSVLYMAVAERVGVELAGVNFPAHFLLRCAGGSEELFIDAFHGGEFLDRAACLSRLARRVSGAVQLSSARFEPCSTRTIVARMLRNLKAIYLGEGDHPAAFPVLRRLAALEHDDPIEARDFGLVCLRCGREAEAIRPLARYALAFPDADDASSIRSLLQAARREVASWN
jgi:regulator of sirC expression with transglutaminase-like and TPR domain